MFNLHNFVMKTLMGMNGSYPEFQVREYALNWYSKSVLTDADLEEIDRWYIKEETPDDTITEDFI